MLSDLLKPAFEKSSKENPQQISKNNQIINAYLIDVFAYKMTMNERSTTRGLGFLIGHKVSLVFILERVNEYKFSSNDKNKLCLQKIDYFDRNHFHYFENESYY